MRTLNQNKSSKLETAIIKEIYVLPYNGETRYRLSYYKEIITGIPLLNNPAPLQVGDKVIILFTDSKVEDTPFIIGKYNQRTAAEEKMVAAFKEIKTIKNPSTLVQETDSSVIKMDSGNKKITIGNKNSSGGEIVVDGDNVTIGGVSINDSLKKLNETITESLNDKIMKSKRDIRFETEDGKFTSKAQEVSFNSDNFMIRNNNDFLIETNHLNLSSSFLEFNVITPKGYSLSEKNAFSFFAVDGHYSISLGKGDFILKSALPLSEFKFLISPFTSFSGLASSFSGMVISNTSTKISQIYELSTLEIQASKFEASLISGLSVISLSATSYSVDLLGGLVSLSLGPSSFKVTIAGNSMELTPTGLTVSSGDITATLGDVGALSGAYSLMMHKHPTAVPGGPSPPLPEPPS